MSARASHFAIGGAHHPKGPSVRTYCVWPYRPVGLSEQRQRICRNKNTQSKQTTMSAERFAFLASDYSFGRADDDGIDDDEHQHQGLAFSFGGFLPPRFCGVVDDTLSPHPSGSECDETPVRATNDTVTADAVVALWQTLTHAQRVDVSQRLGVSMHVASPTLPAAVPVPSWRAAWRSAIDGRARRGACIFDVSDVLGEDIVLSMGAPPLDARLVAQYDAVLRGVLDAHGMWVKSVSTVHVPVYHTTTTCVPEWERAIDDQLQKGAMCIDLCAIDASVRAERDSTRYIVDGDESVANALTEGREDAMRAVLERCLAVCRWTILSTHTSNDTSVYYNVGPTAGDIACKPARSMSSPWSSFLYGLRFLFAI